MSLRTCWIWRTSMWSSHLHLDILWGFSGDSDGKESTCNAEAWVWSLSWEDLLEEGIATHFSILAWRIPMDRGTWWATVHGTAKSQTWLSDHRISTCRCELDSYIHLSFSFQIFGHILQAGIELAPPKVEGSVLTTELPGKSQYIPFLIDRQICLKLTYKRYLGVVRRHIVAKGWKWKRFHFQLFHVE